jgi:hypothetical protein
MKEEGRGSGVGVRMGRSREFSAEAGVRKRPIVGTIAGVFGGALDGIRAQLIRWTTLGYTVELLESKGAWKKGDILRLSGAEFHIERQDTMQEYYHR